MPQDFASLVASLGPKPSTDLGQHTTRNYSERFSKELALWIREMVISSAIGPIVLQPEGKVDTIYGSGNRGKSLDVGVLDQNRYLLLNISIKTFNFKDARTKNYRHNYTGRFYELLGEDLDLRRSYAHSTHAALVFLPIDSTTDTDPSSFAHAVRQFSKILSEDRKEHELGFDFVYVALHNSAGDLYFFDAGKLPPRSGQPKREDRFSIDKVLSGIKTTVDARRHQAAKSALPVTLPFDFSEPFNDSDS
jgi:hypothetical protein